MRKVRTFEFELEFDSYLIDNGQTISDLIDKLREIEREVSTQHTIERIRCEREPYKPLRFEIEIEELK